MWYRHTIGIEKQGKSSSPALVNHIPDVDFFYLKNKKKIDFYIGLWSLKGDPGRETHI